MNRTQWVGLAVGATVAGVVVGPAEGGAVAPGGGDVGCAEGPACEAGGADVLPAVPVFAGDVAPAGRVAERDGAALPGLDGGAVPLAPGVAPAAVGTTSAGGLAGPGAGVPGDDVRASTTPPARATQASTAASGSHQRRDASPGGVPGPAGNAAGSLSPVRGTAGSRVRPGSDPVPSGPAWGARGPDVPVRGPPATGSQAAESCRPGWAATEAADADVVSRSSNWSKVGR
jgi:hypothetical protein